MKKIRDAGVLLGYLEDGEFLGDLNTSLQETIEALHERAGNKGKAKGSLTIKVDIEVANAMATIKSHFDAKTPKPERGSTVLFVTDDGELSTEHPRQHDMFIRDADERRRRAGEDD